MANQGLSEPDCDLCIFKGIEGVDESEESVLVALLDDLHEDTLMTLLDDNLFVKEICEHPFEDTHVNDPAQTSFQPEELSNCEQEDLKLRRPKRLQNDSDDLSVSKKVKLEGSVSPSTCNNNALAHVLHDHCYSFGHEGHQSSSNSDEEASNESDTGYDTMSSSTSPKSNEKGESIHLSGRSDPVALIDERIQHYMCSREVNLTEEEKEILQAEGLPIPTTLPLTKIEEKALKNVRRKIRNRAAAQESRKRKKELMQSLEERVCDYSRENLYLKKRVEALESENTSLAKQLKELQAVVASGTHSNGGHSKVGTYIMVIILCFAVFYGGSSNLWTSQKHAEYATASVRSRSLLSVNPRLNFPTKAHDWFKQIIFMEQCPEGNRSTAPPATSNKISMKSILCPPNNSCNGYFLAS